MTPVRAGLKARTTSVALSVVGRGRGFGPATAAAVTLFLVVQAFRPAVAQQPNPNAAANFVKVQGAVVALTHVRVIDGTGAPARDDQTVVIRDGVLAAIGDASRTVVPAGATVIDLPGRSVIPGLVMLHEHLYYTTGPGVYGQLGLSFSRLYLAGGVTTMRTAGNTKSFTNSSRWSSTWQETAPVRSAFLRAASRSSPCPTSEQKPTMSASYFFLNTAGDEPTSTL